MSRTDDLRQGGATTDRTGGGGNSPFLKWPKDREYAWVEGRIRKIWKGKFGETATLKISAVSEGLVAEGKDEDGQKYSTDPKGGDEVNVGLNPSALQGTLGAEDIGTDVHIAFEGWKESKGGTQYRLFTVLLLEDRGGAPRSAEGLEQHEQEVGATTGHAGPGAPDSDIPF